MGQSDENNPCAEDWLQTINYFNANHTFNSEAEKNRALRRLYMKALQVSTEMLL